MAHHHSPRFLKLVEDSKQRIKEIDRATLKRKLENRERFHLVDVREAEEYASGRIPGAQNVCKGIIEQHGGTIGVESRVGEGSSFYFLLPRVDVPAVAGVSSPPAGPRRGPCSCRCGASPTGPDPRGGYHRRTTRHRSGNTCSGWPPTRGRSNTVEAARPRTRSGPVSRPRPSSPARRGCRSSPSRSRRRR